MARRLGGLVHLALAARRDGGAGRVKVATLLDRRAGLLERREKLRALVAEDRAVRRACGRWRKRRGSLISGGAKPRARAAARGPSSRLRKSGRPRASKRRSSRLRASASRRSRRWRRRRRADRGNGRSAGAFSCRSLDFRSTPLSMRPKRALDAWGEVPEALEALAREERRIAGMRRDNADFEKRRRRTSLGLGARSSKDSLRDRDQDVA